MKLKIGGVRRGEEFATANRLQALKLVQGAMESVGESAFVAPQVGEHDHGRFEYAARFEDCVAHKHIGFVVPDLLESPFGVDATIGAQGPPGDRGGRRRGFDDGGFLNDCRRVRDWTIAA